ncbi:hypothetical protein [Rhodanobacter spathiphylli]|uniref:hypothetical protein n=1 Tax=Rhodanobacter spathiphylli TaxID=347483 RepID=UPI0012FCB634|nr:hypothetical protein [Rhodanobacter spathiphylli]
MAALCIAEEMKCGIGTTTKAIVAAAARVDVKLTTTQVSNYFDGRNEPSRSVVNPLAERLGMPDLRVVSEWPWKLLTPWQLTLGDVEEICAPPYSTAFQLPNDRLVSFNRRGQSRWHEPKKFQLAGRCFLSAEAPEVFWLHAARVRAALALKDYESFNAHYFALISALPSIARHRAVRPHTSMLLSCIGMLLEHIDARYRWFRVNWDAVAVCLATDPYGSKHQDGDCGEATSQDGSKRGSAWRMDECDNVFFDVFDGNRSGVEVEYSLRGINPFHPTNLIRALQQTG